MKAVIASLLVFSFTVSAFASLPIFGWKSTELQEADASLAVVEGVRRTVEDENSCSLEEIWGLEAINHLVDPKGNPAIIVWSTVRTDGASCRLDTYLDCSTSFHKIGGQWTYIATTCEPEEVVE